MRSYRACDRFTDRKHGRHNLDLCTLVRVFWFAFRRAVGLVALTFLTVAALVLFSVAAYMAFLDQYAASHGNLLLTILVLIGKTLLFVAPFVGIAIALCGMLWLVLSLADFVERMKGELLGARKIAPKPTPERKRGDSIFCIAGQWAYDRMHGICRKIEVI